MKTVALLLAMFSGAALGQFKCTGADGAVTFQQTACATSEVGVKLDIRVAPASPEDGRAAHIQRAIAVGDIVIGMTRRELDRTMRSDPTTVNSSIYPSGARDQLVYEQPGRTLYVYIDNGIVTSMQSVERTASAEVSAPRYSRPCPSRTAIRDIEIEQSKIANRDKDRLQVELARQLADAKACR